MGWNELLGAQLNLRLGSSGRLLRTGAWLACDALQVHLSLYRRLLSDRQHRRDARLTLFAYEREQNSSSEKTRDAQKEVSHLTFIGYPCAKKGVNNVMLIIVSRRERTHAFSLSYDKHRVFKNCRGSRLRAGSILVSGMLPSLKPNGTDLEFAATR
jgi:hypothetical protein